MSLHNFAERHIGPRETEYTQMLKKTGVSSLDELIEKTIPKSIRSEAPLNLPEGISESDYFKSIREIASKNKMYKTFIGLGYYNTILPAVIQRNILENPSWYTSYTPYQAEISQGRLEALLNFQTMVMELTGMEIANASLLDESSAAAEAMIMMFNMRSRAKTRAGVNKFFVDKNTFPTTLNVLKTRAESLDIELVTGDYTSFSAGDDYFGCLVQYPAADGAIRELGSRVSQLHEKEVLVAVAADLLSLALLKPPGEWDADIVMGSTQRFGVPMGYGGPYAAFFATREKYKRNVPGRIIGVSLDRLGKPALRMALQTREQHIKRERATSNICTAQALLATMAGMYGAWHGPDGLEKIARHIHRCAASLAGKLAEMGFSIRNRDYFDTLSIELPADIRSEDVQKIALEKEINFWYPEQGTVWISLDESTQIPDLNLILEVFAGASGNKMQPLNELIQKNHFDDSFKRESRYMQQDVFRAYRSETEMMRYIKKLERKDFSLTQSMISLGSCTMKLNAAVEMLPLSWPEFGAIHPFVPLNQAEGYQQLIYELGRDLKIITGFEEISFMPNSGATGEYTGLAVIMAYHKSRGEGHRKTVLIPASAHGTNPASAVMAGMDVVVVDCDEKGNICLDSLKSSVDEHRENLGAFMVTYPSTHGVFEEEIVEMIEVIHDNGGQVYMDGANMNAQVGLTNPARIGADVCHLNLHKTFAIPHGGGGPGVGPIGVAGHLVEFLPTHPLVSTGGVNGIPAVAGAPWGSASILTISHAYIKMLGGKGLTNATKIAILNANYLAACLNDKFPVLYTGKNGFVGHEMILECRHFKQEANITEADIAKRLMDYGFHAPTLSFPVHGTLMVEPTESESLYELDRFVTAMSGIYEEIMQVKSGKSDPDDNVLKNAPHTVEEATLNTWDHSYGREEAGFPASWLYENKFWPAVSRVDDAHGDRNLVCSCAPIEAYRKDN